MTISTLSPFDALLGRQGVVILDGGLATELEARGHSLDDPLWSARLLLDDPQAIEDVHLDYLRSGADCLTTASYQATPQGMRERGISTADALSLLQSSVMLADNARRRFLDGPHDARRCKPLIAASIGPYGAYRHDGSEYRGDYGLSKTELIEFHRPRFEILAQAPADLLAFETIPSLLEAEALVALLETCPNVRAWLSFSCRDASRTCGGDALRRCAQVFGSHPQLVAIGVNCTAPEHIGGLIEILAGETKKPIIVYPNSGEIWDASRRAWDGERDERSFADGADRWFEADARLIGGCCRTDPEDIRRLALRLRGFA